MAYEAIPLVAALSKYKTEECPSGYYLSGLVGKTLMHYNNDPGLNTNFGVQGDTFFHSVH